MAIEFARRLSLIAFAAVSVRGLLSGTDFQSSMQMALVATALFFALGLIFGELARRVIEENVQTEIARFTAEQNRREPAT